MTETESISEEVRQQREREQQIYEDNTTEEEREIWWKLLRIFEHFRDNIFPQKYFCKFPQNFHNFFTETKS